MSSEKPTLSSGQGNACGLTTRTRFHMPVTSDFVEELSSAKCLKGAPTQLYILAFTVTALTVFLMGSLPRWVFVVQFVVWRLLYNIGIGYVLYTQSNRLRFTEWVASIIDKPSFAWIRKKIEDGTILKDEAGNDREYKMKDFPVDFNAWIVFRIGVNIILANDLVSYFVFTVVYFQVPATFSWYEVFSYVTGLALIAFAFWSKSDAHRVLGNFAWYWGDFFFTVDADLTFDGIFQMFPHPMYTVGYCFYYGLSLISHSYMVFYMSVLAHILQLTFLVLVEEPHIAKIYGQLGSPTEELRAKDELAFKDQWGFFSTKRDMILLFNLNPFRATDIFTCLIIVYSAIIAYSIIDWKWHLFHLVVWRLFHTVGMGYLLTMQAKNDFWVKQFSSPQAGFDSWKKIYNLSLTMNHALFFVLAVHCFRFLPDDALILPGDYPFYCFKICCGLLLIALNVYVSEATHSVLGDFGWFYGDFFVRSIPHKLTYSGIYRYMNNPESTIGFAGYYGVAMVSSSYRVGVVAVLCHASALLFSRLVEEPFMKQRYGNDVRAQGGLTKEASKIVGKLMPNGSFDKKTQ